jgi:CheY-like chemotaxis protein
VSARRLRILAADDHPVNRMIVQTYLQLAGHQVTLVEDGSRPFRRCDNSFSMSWSWISRCR